MRLCSFLLWLGLGAASSVSANTYIVTNPNDSGAGSLRSALAAANANTGLDRIEFAIPGSGPYTIFLTSTLTIADAVEIDGYTQPGSHPNTLAEGSDADIRIVLDASSMTPGYQVVMKLPAYGATLRGLAFVRGFEALRVDGGENHIEGCFFGLEADGITLAPLEQSLDIYGDFNIIGGVEPAQRNVFTGHKSAVNLLGSGAIRNVIIGNLVGADRTSTPRPGRQQNGIAISGGAHVNRIGDYGDGRRGNVIVGHSQYGVSQIGGGNGNAVVGNRISGNAGMATVNNWFSNQTPCQRDDALDADVGTNDCMNWASIDSARYDQLRTLRVAGHFRSEPNQVFRVALYANGGRCRSAVGGEGDRYLSYIDFVRTDSDGNASFLFYDLNTNGYIPREVSVVLGREVSYVDSTSEYSPCKDVELFDRVFLGDFD